MTMIRKGKVKEVHTTDDPDKLLFRFTDQISVFDKIIPTLIDRKGETLARTSAYWFMALKSMGINNHFVRLEGPDRMLVRKIEVRHDLDRLGQDQAGYLIPLEFICRHYVAGSLHDRFKRGEISPEAVGLPKGRIPEYGEELPEPYFEATTKLEKVDRVLTPEIARDMASLTREEWADIKETVLRIDSKMARGAKSRGLIHVDGKKEFGFDDDRDLMLIDTFGTADEDRFWDRARYEQGEFVELSKEFVRQHYRETGYHAALMEARRKGEKEPEMPPLPDDVASQCSKLYIELYERITGEEF